MFLPQKIFQRIFDHYNERKEIHILLMEVLILLEDILEISKLPYVHFDHIFVKICLKTNKYNLITEQFETLNLF